MAEIKINLIEIDSAIQKLNELKTSCENVNMNPPQTQGGGKVVGEIEEIADTYITVRDNLCLLFENTIMFLQNIRDSYGINDRYS